MLTKPRKHQAEIISTIKAKNYYGLLWDMGLGKTWIGCWLLDTHYIDDNDKFLIICPTTVMSVWKKEIQKHTDIAEEAVCVLEGSTKKRAEKLQQNYNIYIINYEALRWVQDVLLKMKFKIKIADESHYIKSFAAQQAKLAVKIKATKSFIMTGTPITRDYLDIFMQWQFMDNGKTFGTSFYGFRRKYFYDANADRYKGNFPEWKLKPGMEDVLNKIIAASSHRLEKQDCLDLPPRVEKLLYCELADEQKKIYNELREECVAFIKDNPDNAITTQQALLKMIRLRQITSGFAILDDYQKPHYFKKNPKMELLLETVDEILSNPKNKIIIWAHFIHDIENILKNLNKYNPVAIYGAINKKERGDIVDKFQEDPKCRVFIGNPKAAGLGITLTAANYDIVYSSDFNYGNLKQAQDRNYRDGSEIHKSIIAIKLICKDTTDEHIIKNIDSKAKLIDSIMDYIKKH